MNHAHHAPDKLNERIRKPVDLDRVPAMLRPTRKKNAA